MCIKKGNEHIYYQWQNIRLSCYNKQHPRYKKYGAVGITVSKKWDKFPPFLKWWQSKIRLTILSDKQFQVVRDDKDGQFSPSNCRIDPKPKTRKKTCLTIESKGFRGSVKEWAARSGISIATIYRRMDQGIKPQYAVRPKRPYLIIAYGKRQSVSEWARETGLPASTIQARLNRGWPDVAALKPVNNK